MYLAVATDAHLYLYVPCSAATDAHLYLYVPCSAATDAHLYLYVPCSGYRCPSLHVISYMYLAVATKSVIIPNIPIPVSATTRLNRSRLKSVLNFKINKLTFYLFENKSFVFK